VSAQITSEENAASSNGALSRPFGLAFVKDLLETWRKAAAIRRVDRHCAHAPTERSAFNAQDGSFGLNSHHNGCKNGVLIIADRRAR
jgi:hypothetical protein